MSLQYRIDNSIEAPIHHHERAFLKYISVFGADPLKRTQQKYLLLRFSSLILTLYLDRSLKGRSVYLDAERARVAIMRPQFARSLICNEY
jgi:hypothetical protein